MVAMCNAESDSLVGNWAISTAQVTSVARSTGTSADSQVCDGLWKLMLVYNIRVQPFPSPDGDVKPSKQRHVEAGSRSGPMHSEYLPHLLSHVTANNHTHFMCRLIFSRNPSYHCTYSSNYQQLAARTCKANNVRHHTNPVYSIVVPAVIASMTQSPD